MLEKMLFWTKPGGIVAAQEFDFGAIAVEPLCPAMAEFNRLFESVFRGHGRNLRAGRQLPAQFEAAGMGVPDGTLAEAKFLPAQGHGANVDRRLPKPVSRQPPRSASPIRRGPINSRPTWPRPPWMGGITASPPS